MPRLPKVNQMAHMCSHVTDGNELSNCCLFPKIHMLKKKIKVNSKRCETPAQNPRFGRRVLEPHSLRSRAAQISICSVSCLVVACMCWLMEICTVFKTKDRFM